MLARGLRGKRDEDGNGKKTETVRRDGVRKEYAEALVSEATNKFIERVLAWRLPDRARLDGPEGDERALENPPGARHGEIGGSHGGGRRRREEEWRKGGGRCRVTLEERRRERDVVARGWLERRRKENGGWARVEDTRR